MKTPFLYISAILIISLTLISASFSALVSLAAGGCSVGGCGSSGDDSWLNSAQDFVNTDVPLVGVSASAGSASDVAYSRSFLAGREVGSPVNGGSEESGPGENGSGSGGPRTPALEAVYVTPGTRSELFLEPQMLKSLDALTEGEIVLDASEGRRSGEAHIIGAIKLPASGLYHDNGSLKSPSELSGMLGRAGVSQSDSVMVYGDTFASGEATAVLLALYSLGQEQVRALDGGLDNWMGASLPLETKENVRPQVRYDPKTRPDIFVDYDYVLSGAAQMVDARSFQDYGAGKIGNATLIRPEDVLIEGRLSPGLNDTFSRLNVSRTVVVYSDDIRESSIVWFALWLMGYDSRVYLWQDWVLRQESAGA